MANREISNYDRANVGLHSNLIRDILPQHFVADYPNLITFLEVYYEFLDADETISLINELYGIHDIERADVQQLDLIFATIATGSSRGNFQEPREVLRNFANFYRVKGTKYAAEGFFRSFFGESVIIEYPKANIFIVSESQIGVESQRFIQNGALYQIFSTLIKSSLPIAKWKDLYKVFVHPAGFFLGGEVVLELVSGNSILSEYMPISIEVETPAITVEGTSAVLIPFAYTNVSGIFPDDLDSDTNVQYVSLTRRIPDISTFTLANLETTYGTIANVLHVNSPRFDQDSTNNIVVRMDNTAETMDQNTYTYSIDSA